MPYFLILFLKRIAGSSLPHVLSSFSFTLRILSASWEFSLIGGTPYDYVVLRCNPYFAVFFYACSFGKAHRERDGELLQSRPMAVSATYDSHCVSQFSNALNKHRHKMHLVFKQVSFLFSILCVVPRQLAEGNCENAQFTP